MGEEKNENAIPPELLEYLREKIEEEKKEKEKKAREEAIMRLKKYLPNLKGVPEKYDAKHLNTIADVLAEFHYDEVQARPNFFKDVKSNAMWWLFLGAIVVVGVLGVIF